MVEGDPYILIPFGNKKQYYAVPLVIPTEDDPVALISIGNRSKYAAAKIGIPPEDDTVPLVPIGNKELYAAIIKKLPCCQLVNAGFETGDMTGWDFFYSNHNDGTVSVSNADHHTGSYSLKIYLLRNGLGICEAGIRGTFVCTCGWEAGDILSFWYRWPTPQSYHRVRAAMQYYSGGVWNYYAYGAATNDLTGNWALYQWTLPAMQNLSSPQALVIGAWLDTDLGTTGTCYIDDVAMACS